MMMMSETISSNEGSTEFFEPPDSPGSSVSTRLQDEYDELLKYAVIVPSFDPNAISKALISDTKGSFPLGDSRTMESLRRQEEEDEDTEVEDSPEHDPDHGVSDQQRVGFDLQDSDLYDETGSRMNDVQSGRSIPRLATMPMGDPLATKLFHRPEADSPRSSISTYSQGALEDGYSQERMGSEFGCSVTIDQDVGRMENLLDQWTGDLKRNILAEFGQAKIKLIGQHKHQAQRDREKHSAEVQRLHTEMDRLRELLHTYETSIERKDQVITNLTRGMHKQKEKFEMLRTFSEWKIKHNDNKREVMAGKLAEKHYHRTLQKKCWDAWHAVVESRWRQHVEKACQAKAQEVCMSLTNDYETKIASLNEALEAAREEVTRLHTARDHYEETMKKAFMRGVCALNLEAMSMFHDSENKDPEEGTTGFVEGQQMSAPVFTDPSSRDDVYTTTVAQEPVYSSNPPGAPAPRVITSQAATRGPVVGSKVITAQARTSGPAKSGKSKVLSAKITTHGAPTKATSSLGGAPGLAPPMSSVVVERHQPVSKQTIGHAAASRYIRNTDTVSSTGGSTKQPVIVQRKIAGQSVPNQNIQTVKVVE